MKREPVEQNELGSATDDFVEVFNKIGAPEDLVDRIRSVVRAAEQSERQHFVPKGYLRKWARDRHLGVWDTWTGSSFRATPENIAVVGDYYTLEMEGGPSRGLEGLLSIIDNELIAYVGQLIDESWQDDPANRYGAAGVLAYLAYRGPLMRRLFDETSTLVATAGVDQRFQQEGLTPGGIRVEHPNENQIKLLTEAMRDVVPNWARRPWVVHQSESEIYRTSDSPVVIDGGDQDFRPGGVIADRVMIPLTPQHLLVMESGDEPATRWSQATDDVRRVFDREIVRQRERFVIGTPAQILASRNPRVERRLHVVVECAEHEADSCHIFSRVAYRRNAEVVACPLGRFRGWALPDPVMESTPTPD